jgi:hypothetical protein
MKKNQVVKTQLTHKQQQKSNRKCPSHAASEFNVGQKKKGNDGNMYQVKENKNGIKRWCKVSQQKANSSISIPKAPSFSIPKALSHTNFKKPPSLHKAPQKFKNKYFMKRKLGTGSAGQVWLAKDKENQQYAVKKGWKNSLQKQNRILEVIKEKNLCQYFLCPIAFYEQIDKYGDAYIVMDYLENYRSLYEAINKKYCISIKNRNELKVKLNTAIELLHNNNIVHSDIKPDNIMVRIDRNKKEILPDVRIIDLGGALEKISNGKKMKINTFSRKYFDFSISHPEIQHQYIPNSEVFAKEYTFQQLKRLDKSALQKTFNQIDQIILC